MKKILSIATVLATAVNLQAALVFDSGFLNDGAVPDGNPTGWSDTRLVSGFAVDAMITDVNVTLNISGGYNGDLYGYLVHGSGFAVLLNRVGKTATDMFGYSDGGMTVILSDQADIDIHSYGSLTAPYIYQPDARYVNPSTVTDESPRDLPNYGLAAFDGLNPNGTWTLFLADMATGDMSTVVSWGLEITAVPETTTSALIVFGILFGLASTARWRPGRRIFVPR